MSIKKQDIHDHFLAVYNDHNQAIFRYLAIKIWDREIAKDLLQDVFMRFWNHIDGGGEVRDLKPFLYRIARNLVIDQIRKKKPVYSLDNIMEEGIDFGEDDNPIKSHADKNFAENVIPKLDELESDYKEILVMKYLDDLTIPEIADILEIPANTVSVRLHRAHTKLKNIIEKDK
jgi:RNA polymerase sigma-70 factor, ECF subfamily